MDYLNIGLIGYGVVGQGLVKVLKAEGNSCEKSMRLTLLSRLSVTAVYLKNQIQDWITPS